MNPLNWIEPSPRCGDHLMEDDWQEGFSCSLAPGHDGPHREMTDLNGISESTDVQGRRYRWAYEWEYLS